MSLGFINHISNHQNATIESYKSIRKFYPDSPVFFSIDGGSDIYYSELHDDYLEILTNTQKLGYPPYEKNQVLEWLKRMYIGVLKLNTDHFMMIEDDVLILNEIKYDHWVECLGHNIKHGNKIPDFIMYEIQRISKNIPITDFYGNGGGSIFRSETFLSNYDKITKYFDQWWYLYKLHFYPPCGYMDCYMTLFYMLCGKRYTPNLRMLNLDPHDSEQVKLIHSADKNQIEQLYSNDFDIVHGAKFYY